MVYMTTDQEAPCRVCGSPVRLRTENEPRRLAETTPRTTQVRVCTNGDCDTNHPQRRTLGQVV